MARKDLAQAKDAKKDEFYTKLDDIAKELKNYRPYFKDKVVFCNCDDPYESNFFKYFALNFNALGLKKLIATCYVSSPVMYTQLSLFDDMEKRMRNWDSYGILRVGTSITIGSQFLPGYVKAFNHLYPGTEVHAVVASSEQLEKKVLTNEIDFALIEGIVHSPTINSEPYMEDRLSVICSANGAFKQGQELSLE